MSTALPRIDQAGKSAGTGGQSRDDLDLYTVPGTEIQFSDVGGDATSWQWKLIDQPPGATAYFSNPVAQSTNLVGATVAGSYLVQLAVDGGLVPGSIRRIIAGIQLSVPSWVTPPLNRALRIPAKGETFEFNVESSPGVGPNARGWAQEMDHWFRTLASFGFGFRAANNGTPIGSSSFETINFVGATASDAGGGVLSVPVGPSAAGVVDTVTAAEAINAGDPVALNAAGQAVRAKADWLLAPFEVYGVAQNSALLAGSVTVTLMGLMPYSGATPLPSPGTAIYLGVGGGWSAAPPSLLTPNSSIVKLGIVKSSALLLVRVQEIAQT